MDALKGLATEHWYRALTLVSAGALVGVAAIGNDPALRKGLLLLCLGGFFCGIGQWIDHPYQEAVDPHGRYKISGYRYRRSIGGTAVQVVGAILAARALWLLW